MTPLLIIGAGGHARVILELTRAAGQFEVVGLLDPQPVSDNIMGVSVLGGDDLLPELYAQGYRRAFVALGDNRIRQKVSDKLTAMGFEQPSLVHPSADISPSADIGPGALVMARAVLGTQSRLNEGAILNTGAIADHDNVLSRYCHVAPGCALAGGVRVGERSFLGVGTCVRPETSIGADVVVGAGAAVVADIADGARVVGVPAKPMKGR